jgi:GR25 family glycosyltransferase involved in LPS biosynthesis
MISQIHQHIDHIIYINLARRQDRRDHIESQLRAYGITEYERFDAFDRPGQGIVGCGYSHLAVLKLARERKYENVLILEDDFRFVVSPEEFENQLARFFESPVADNYDVCMFGYNLRESSECPDTPFLTRVRYAQTASAYLVHARYYDALIELYEWAIPLLEKTGQHWIYANDVVWKDLQVSDKWYCFTERIGRQLNGFSDNAGRYVEYNC